MTDELWHGSYSLALEAICERDCSIHGNLLLKVLFMKRKESRLGRERERESAVKSPWPDGFNYTNYSKQFK